MNPDQLENFERAFSSGTGGCRRTCCCGVTFYDAANSYDWEEGELEALEKDTKARPLDYSISDIDFEGHQYVADCACWHKRAEQIVGFITVHGWKIAEFLTLEKKRKQREADFSPVVKEPAATGEAQPEEGL